MTDVFKEITEKVEEILGDKVRCIAPYGSTYILGSGKDVDLLVLCSDMFNAAGALVEAGFNFDCGDTYDAAVFISLRKDNFNVICCDSPRYFNASVKARDFCKEHAIVSKTLRTAIHELVREAANEL